MEQRVRKNLPEILGALALVAFALLVIAVGFDYPTGSLTSMGPGFFPITLGILLAILGMIVAFEVQDKDGSWEAIPIRPFLSIFVGILAWTLMVEPFGLVPASVALIVVSALAVTPFRPVPILVLAAGLCVSGYLLFVQLLGMPLTAFGR